MPVTRRGTAVTSNFVHEVSKPPDRYRFTEAHLWFQDGTLNGWSTRRLSRPHSACVQSEIVRAGQFSCRFELRAEDYVSEGRRAELRDWPNAPFDRDIWYAFSTYLPPDFPVEENVGCVLAQWHDQARLGDPSGKPPIALRFRGGLLSVTGAFADFACPDRCERLSLADNLEFLPGRWHDFIFRIKWSRYGQSSASGWLNNQQIVDYVGRLGYQDQELGPYFKLGVYCHDVPERPHVAYHDQYARGYSKSFVDCLTEIDTQRSGDLIR